MTGTMVQRIAEWVLAFDHTAVDAHSIELMKHSVLDSLGCAILTLDEDCVSGILEYVRSADGSAQASLIRSGRKLPRDHTTSFGFTVPAFVARLLGLDAAKTAHAIANSAAQSASLGVVRRGQLSHSKFLASALVAERGVEAALLAAAGVTGPMTAFEDTRGISNGIFQSESDLDSLVAPL